MSILNRYDVFSVNCRLLLLVFSSFKGWLLYQGYVKYEYVHLFFVNLFYLYEYRIRVLTTRSQLVFGISNWDLASPIVVRLIICSEFGKELAKMNVGSNNVSILNVAILNSPASPYVICHVRNAIG